MIEFQRLILGDRVRNEAFAKALARTIVRGRSTVADLGSGTGFLAFLARRLGAKRCWLYEVSELLDLSKELAKRNGSAAKVGTADDQAFLDTRNPCTVRVAPYKPDDAGKSLANTAYDYLRHEGIPAIRPIVSGGTIVICAGYAKSTSELEQLVRRIRELPGPSAKSNVKPFHDAYLVNIDPYVQR